MKPGDRVCVRFGEWGFEWGVYVGVNISGCPLVRFAPFGWHRTALMTVLPFDIVQAGYA